MFDNTKGLLTQIFNMIIYNVDTFMATYILFQ